MASNKRTVMVTGANSGIGRATALAVARAGFVCVGTVRSEAKAATLRDAAVAAGVEVGTQLLDVTDAARCEEVIDLVRPWGLVNNAGYGHSGAIEDVGDAEAEQIVATMVLAPLRLSRLAVPHMRNGGGGRIVNMSSVFGRTTAPLIGWYAGCKHAMEALSDALRVEVASSGIKVCLIEPGGIRTELWDSVGEQMEDRPESRYSAAYRRSLAGTRRSLPLMGKPEGVADAVVAALSSSRPRARYLLGIDAAGMSALQSFTPAPVRDLVTRRILGL